MKPNRVNLITAALGVSLLGCATHRETQVTTDARDEPVSGQEWQQPGVSLSQGARIEYKTEDGETIIFGSSSKQPVQPPETTDDREAADDRRETFPDHNAVQGRRGVRLIEIPF